jgi:hypothetical protein
MTRGSRAARSARRLCAALCALSLHAGSAPAQVQGSGAPVFLGQHVLYNRTFASLPAHAFDGLRIWGAEGSTWAELEPRAGEFDFVRLDAHVAAAAARGMELMYTLGQTPRWASARPDEKGAKGMGAAAEPARMDIWARYVRTVAERYKGRIAAYEIMNEPRVPEAVRPWSPGFFSGSAAILAQMTRIAAAEVRKADPAAKLVCPSMDGGADGLKRLDYFLGTGAGGACDVIGFHYYLPHHSIDELRELVEGTLRIKARHGLARLPLWDTETGLLIADAGDGLAPRAAKGPLSRMFGGAEAARLAAKLVVVSHQLGVERTYWFAYDSSWMGSTVADKRLNRLNAFGQSMAVLRRWLSGNQLRNCAGPDGGMACEVRGRKGKLGTIYWGGGRSADEWRRSGYAAVEFLDGGVVRLDASEGAAIIPKTSDEVVFLTCPCS